MSEASKYSMDAFLSAGAPGARRDLMLSALKLFSTQGFEKTKTRDISAGAGLSAGAMYVHFESKESILYEITLAGHKAVNALVEEVLAGEGSARHRVTTFVEGFTAWHAENAWMARVIYREWPLLKTEHRDEIVGLRRVFQESVVKLLDEGYRSGDFAVPNAEVALYAVLSLGIDVSRWYAEAPRFDIPTLSSEYAVLALRILGASEA